jgi:hypothetical protein
MKNILILPLIMFSILSNGQNKQYPPRNDVGHDPTLEKFINNVLQAIEKKDETYLISVLDKDVTFAFDGEGGIKAFEETYQLNNDSSSIWPLLKRVIGLGGVFLHDEADERGKYQFVFPYVYDLELNIDDDYYSIGVITGKNVNLREKPDTKSVVKTQLTYDVIWYLYGDEYGETQSGTNEFGEPEWYLIETYDRKNRGWVNWRYVYSPVGYRLFLYKNDKGIWKISAFLAGD